MVSLEADAFKRFAKSLYSSGEVDFDFARKTVACFFQRIGACQRMCNPQCSHDGNCDTINQRRLLHRKAAA